MTLVYAKVEADHIWFVADTAVTSFSNPNPDRNEVEVKFRFCKKYRFVAYSGDQHTGRKVLAKVEEVNDLQSVLRILLQNSQNGSVEFLLGDFENVPMLYKVSNKSDEVRAGYIGSKLGFEVFQKCMNTGAPSSFSLEQNSLVHFTFAEEVVSEGIKSGIISLTEAIVSGSDRTVSGFALPGLLYAGGHFIWNYTFITTNSISGPMVEGDSLEDNCSAEGGGKWDVLSTSMDKDGFALYSPLSRVGRIFLREIGIGYRTHKFLNCSPKSFQNLARKKLEVEVDVCVFESSDLA